MILEIISFIKFVKFKRLENHILKIFDFKQNIYQFK